MKSYKMYFQEFYRLHTVFWNWPSIRSSNEVDRRRDKIYVFRRINAKPKTRRNFSEVLTVKNFLYLLKNVRFPHQCYFSIIYRLVVFNFLNQSKWPFYEKSWFFKVLIVHTKPLKNGMVTYGIIRLVIVVQIINEWN